MTTSYKKTFPANSSIQGWITAGKEWNPLINEDKGEEVQKSNSELLFKMYHQDNELEFSERTEYPVNINCW